MCSQRITLNWIQNCYCVKTHQTFIAEVVCKGRKWKSFGSHLRIFPLLTQSLCLFKSGACVMEKLGSPWWWWLHLSLKKMGNETESASRQFTSSDVPYFYADLRGKKQQSSFYTEVVFYLLSQMIRGHCDRYWRDLSQAVFWAQVKSAVVTGFFIA